MVLTDVFSPGGLIAVAALAVAGGMTVAWWRARQGSLRVAQAQIELAAALKHNREMFQLVMDTIPQFIFWKNRECVYLGCNENFATAAGVATPQDIVGKSDYDLAWDRDQADFFRACDRRVMESGNPEFHIIEPQTQANGKCAWLDTNKVPLRDDSGAVVGILGTFEDITTRRELEDRLRHSEKMEAVGRLAGGIAHDFNNVLGGIIGAAELLQRGSLSAERSQRMLSMIISASDRASDLTRKLLDFSRKGKRVQQAMDIHAVMRDAMVMIEPGLGKKISLNDRLDSRSLVVQGDVTQLQNAFINIMLNARDAMADGGSLTISSTVVELREGFSISEFTCAPGPYVVIGIQDTGCGMDQTVLSRMFEPFFTTKATGAGTGLGLPSVQGAIHDHAGAITATSQVGVGTLFQLYLPIERNAVFEQISDSVATSTSGHGLILVVDDEPILRRVASSMLESLGYEVVTAVDGEDAIEVFTQHRGTIDAVVLDLVLPRMDGEACFHALKALQSDLPMVVVSGFIRDARLDELLAVGLMGVLAKPYRMEDLARLVGDALRKHRSSAQRRAVPTSAARPAVKTPDQEAGG